MGGSWSVRVYETGFAHPVGDFTGDLAKVLSFPDAKNTTFKIEGVTFPLPPNKGQNVFQISFTAQDFSHATYFCLDIYYNLDTGKITTAKNGEAAAPIPATYAAASEAITGPTLFKEDADQNHCFDLQVMNNNTECFKDYWIKHQYQFLGFNKGRCPSKYNVADGRTDICGSNVVARNLGMALTQTEVTAVSFASSCNTKPGIPSVFEKICAAAKDATACNKLSTTCQWSGPSPGPTGCKNLGNLCSGSAPDPQGTCCSGAFCKYWQTAGGNICSGCYNCHCDSGGPGTTDDPSKCINTNGNLCPFTKNC